MIWEIYADTFSSDEFNNGEKFQIVKFNKNVILTTIRTWVVIYDAPSFTNMTMNIYSCPNNAKGSLLYSATNSFSLIDICNENNGVREIYFNFDSIALNKDVEYAFVLEGTGAAFTDASHIAWRVGYPDPVYTNGLIITYTSGGAMPFTFAAIGSEF